MTGRPSLPIRRGYALAALALFLGGSNFCLVAGLAAAHGSQVPMGCMTIAAASAPTSHCGGRAAPHGGGGSSAPASESAAAPSPCCVALLPVTPPAVDALVLDQAPAPVAPALDLPLETHVEHEVALDAHAPPESPPGSPLGERAPPLL